ncbi:MAG TPA: biotin--[acetyl-CoA-carboxylase] ligase [Longimicrobiales bacterium]|nr:biotin--[acetyl-CoA-carboxylase] ligase [Longimicrobiales bacterium]
MSAPVAGPTPGTHWEGEPVECWREAWGVPLVEAWASIGSTNDRALELAAAGAGPFTVVVADEQTRGRGRRGASWHSPSGSGLWMSMVLPPRPAPAWLPLLVGLAVAEAIEGATGAVGVGIKWPNDLVLGAGKVGGILCESAGGAAVAGVGINVRAPREGFPEGIRTTATALDVEGAKSLSISRLAGMIIDGVEQRLDVDAASLDLATLRRLAARDVLAGRRIRTEEAGEGTARGIGPEGALLLERPDGSRVNVSSGSVRVV